LGTRTQIGLLVEQPFELGAGEVGIDQQAGVLGDFRLALAECVADGGAAAALPDDRTMDRAAAATLPDDERLSLIGDADAGDVSGLGPGGGDGLFGERDD